MSNVDVWDAERDAMKWPGGMPIVAHPPCRLWGCLSHMSTAPEEEKKLGIFAVEMVRKWGGALEHPQRSKLWKAMNMPKPKDGIDKYGGFTVSFPQWWFGHPAEKWTWIYIVGIKPKDLPNIPYKIGRAEFELTDGASHPQKGEPNYRPPVERRWRDATPPELANWLVSVARLTQPFPVLD